MIKNVLFDLDGTLIDSSKCIYTVYEQLFSELGLEMPPQEERRKLIGPPVETTMKRFLTDGFKEAADRFRAIYLTVDLASTNVLYDGIAEALAALKADGKRLFVATSKSEPVAKTILELMNVADYFDAIYGNNAVDRMHKAEVLEALFSECGISKEESILIGDTVFDAEGAAECGIKTGIVNYGFGRKEDFGKYREGIAFFADKAEQIPSLIGELN